MVVRCVPLLDNSQQQRVTETYRAGHPERRSYWRTGACIFDDYTCENHGFVHPGYMGCIGITLSCHLDFRLTGRQTPRAVAWNAGGVYENLKWMADLPPRMVPPVMLVPQPLSAGGGA